MDMSTDTNDLTLKAYENGVAEYNSAANMQVLGSVKEWIDASLSMLKPGAQVLEIGSAHGRDAKYMEDKGFVVHRTDAARSFVEYLKNQGYEASLLNAIKDKLGGPYNMVFANAVLLHFTVEETKSLLIKIKGALAKDGIFAFSVKVGDGTEWSNKKLKEARFFTYWQEEPLRKILNEADLEIVYFKHAKSGHTNKEWFHVICRSRV
jgi:2-polyprenyl-3-methyl-5-hydroxy-6-metoxy-1,4-benzoquinol methylase